jgi:hypothetical protein
MAPKQRQVRLEQRAGAPEQLMVEMQGRSDEQLGQIGALAPSSQYNPHRPGL